MEPLLKIAFNELGTTEVEGQDHNPQILKYAEDTGIKGINTDEIAWCSTFVNWVAMKAGLEYSKKANARSWLNIGKKTSSPKPGDIVVFWREDPLSWKGHVGIFLGFTEDSKRVYCLGGNQGNRVSVTSYSTDYLLSFQQLSSADEMVPPDPVLEQGSKGEKVIALQNALKFLNIDVGTSDGDYGPRTSRGVKELQTRKPGLAIDGVYNQETHDLLLSLMQA